MNEKDKAVLDAARKYASLLHAGNATSGDVRRATIAIQDAALDAFPADSEPQPETVRDVADLRDGEIVESPVGLSWRVVLDHIARPGLASASLEDRAGWISAAALQRLISAGAVTRSPRPAPDPADVERLAEVLEVTLIETGGGHQAMARHLLRSGEITLRGPS